MRLGAVVIASTRPLVTIATQMGYSAFSFGDFRVIRSTGRRQNRLLDEHIEKIVSSYQFRNEEPRYSRRVLMEEIAGNNFNLNLSRYINTAVGKKK
jgi:N-6 DNA Methylase